MKTTFPIATIALLVQALFAADSSPQSQVASATKALANKPNYSWTMTTREGDGSPGRLGPIEGKADKTGLVYLTFSISGVPVEVYLNGPKGAGKALEGWQTLDDIAETSGTAAAVVRYLRSYKAPAAESATLSESAKALKEDEGIVAGELKPEVAKELLERGARRREGQEAPKIENARGTIRFWIQDGVLAKYEVKVRGKITAGDRETEVNRTTTVEIKDPGTTKLAVPAEAKAKMS